jgi:hypothetical protein
MRRHLIAASLMSVTAAAAPHGATAADLPIKAPSTAAVVQTDGFYAWLDGSWQEINLPRYDLGFVFQPTGGAVTSTFSADPRATGSGVSAGVGVLLPTRFGARDRFDVSGSFVHATDSRSGVTTSSAPGAVGLALLNGTVMVDSGCFPGPCSTLRSALSTDYQSWQVSGRFATDYKAGSVIVSPSLALFGGHSHNNQNLAQLQQFVGNLFFEPYYAQTSLTWTDWGARAGLTATIPVTTFMSVSLGGNLGGAARSVSLDGNDFTYLGLFNFVNLATATAISTRASTTAFLANVEGSATFTPAANWTLRIFGGANFDNSVPGVAAPVISGTPLGAAGLPTATPASIKFEAETSFYAGGGMSVKF